MPFSFDRRAFIIHMLLVSIWINLSEVFRYFVIVRPDARSFLAALPDALPMNLPVFVIWGIWDTILTAFVVFLFWLVAQVFGNNYRSVLLAGTIGWAGCFLLVWVGFCNMGLASPLLAFKALPLAWFELVVACAIASWLYQRTLPLHPLTSTSPSS
jgi:hypothetical protein